MLSLPVFYIYTPTIWARIEEEEEEGFDATVVLPICRVMVGWSGSARGRHCCNLPSPVCLTFSASGRGTTKGLEGGGKGRKATGAINNWDSGENQAFHLGKEL